MKISELIRKTGVRKQTIHYYLRNGLLPKPRKMGSNAAEYDQRHVDRIQLIKELQKNYFLPLSAIKKLMKKRRGAPDGQAELKVLGEYFRPLDLLLAGRIKGEKAFLEAVGLKPERLKSYEEWGILTPDLEDGEKVYSYDDQVLGRVIAQWRDVGLTADLGFEPDILRTFLKNIQEMVEGATEYFFSIVDLNDMPQKEVEEVGRMACEVSALFHYHLFHKLAQKSMEEGLRRRSEGASGASSTETPGQKE